jgi:hypothetical protein
MEFELPPALAGGSKINLKMGIIMKWVKTHFYSKDGI